MFFVAITLLMLGYLLISLLFSALWVKESIKNIGAKNFDSLAYIFKCAFLWPYLIVNKDER